MKTLLKVLGLGLLGLFIVGTLNAPKPGQKAGLKSTSEPSETSWVVAACNEAQDAVKSKLKAPATAEFPSCLWSLGQYDIRANKERNTFFVRGHVDAENTFGAKLRRKFGVKLGHSGPQSFMGWSVIQVVFLDE
jgi:hypothetical protein